MFFASITKEIPLKLKLDGHLVRQSQESVEVSLKGVPNSDGKSLLNFHLSLKLEGHIFSAKSL